MGKTQIATILKHEAEIRASYATFGGNNKRARQDRYEEINDVLYKWYSMAEDLLFQLMNQCSKKGKKRQLKLENDWQSLNMLISRHQAEMEKQLWYFSTCY